MGSRQYFGIGLQVFLLITLIAHVLGANQSEYLTWSIDCGSDSNYTDPETGINWVTDDQFIKTGKNAHNIHVPSSDTVVNRKQLNTLRYFDDSRQRHCYVLPVTPSTTYLFRPVFFLGNWTSSKEIDFYLFINATWWLGLEFHPGTDHYVYEAIFYSPGGVLNICLAKTEKQAAFISTLELRRLTPGMYSSSAAGGYQFQSSDSRINAGAAPSGPDSILRYPDDPYDRIWNNSNESWSTATREVNTSGPSSVSQLQNRPPAVVMQDAWITDNKTTLNFTSPDWNVSTGIIVIYCYIMELDGSKSASNVDSMDVLVNDILIGTLTQSSMPQQFTFGVTLPDNHYRLVFKPTSTSTLPPILTAMEVYNLIYLDWSLTAVADVDAVTALQKTVSLTDWTGDPCVPGGFSYDWLSCTYEGDFAGSGSSTYEYTFIGYRITSLWLSNVTTGGTKMKVIPAEVADLTALTYLNVSYNALSGTLISSRQLPNLTVLDVSHNNFSGEVIDFVTSTGLRNIEELYAANNLLQGQVSIFQLKNIQLVDFDDQKINGTLNLSEWNLYWAASVSISSEILAQLIMLRNNKIEDVHPAVDILSWLIKDAYDNVWKFSFARFPAILLSGNPWCSKFDKSLAHRYLCRANETDYVDYTTAGVPRPGSKKADKWRAIVGALVGGCMLLLCGCFGIILLLKLRRKSLALAEIQGALLKQKVQPPFYSYADIRAATKNFSYDNNLGQGAYGAVYRGKLGDGTLVAVKKLFKDKQVLAEFLNEVVLITGIKHRNLTQLKGCCINGNQRILVYEYAENGNLAEALWGGPGTARPGTVHGRIEAAMSWHMRLNICVGIARGLSYLHEELQPRIIHRDIKPANILIDGGFNAKIADFGLARPFLVEQTRADCTRVAGTFGYLAPEYLSRGQLTEKADVFSFGVVLLEIVSGRKCIEQSLAPETISLVSWAYALRTQGKLLDILDSSAKLSSKDEEVQEVIDIAFACLHLDPAQRPSMSQVVSRLQGNASAVFTRPPGLDRFSEFTRKKFIPVGGVRSLSLGSASFPSDTSDQLAFLTDQTSRSDGIQMSDISGR